MEFGDDWKTIEQLREEYGIEDFSLTEEERKKVVELSNEGDIHGLEYLRDIIKARTTDFHNKESLFDCVCDIIKLNGMVAYGEMFSGMCEDFYNELYDVYYKMKMKLFELCGITDKDWENWGC